MQYDYCLSFLANFIILSSDLYKISALFSIQSIFTLNFDLNINENTNN